MIRGGILCVAALAAVSMMGCIGGPDAPDLKAARAQWKMNEPALYAYSVTYNCLCPPGRPVRVVASRESVLVAQMDSPTGPIDVPSPQDYSMDALFDEVDRHLQRDHVRQSASFDPDYGFPAGVSIDFRKHAVDEEYNLTVSDFRPLLRIP